MKTLFPADSAIERFTLTVSSFSIMLALLWSFGEALISFAEKVSLTLFDSNSMSSQSNYMKRNANGASGTPDAFHIRSITDCPLASTPDATSLLVYLYFFLAAELQG